MVERMVLVSGAAAVGKTAFIRHLLSSLRSKVNPCFAKIDCLQTDDDQIFRQLKIPSIAGLSDDICPDHFLVSNMHELIDWTEKMGGNFLIVETAGLCHRCCPASVKTINICIVDCTVSVRSPKKLGPMLTTADMIVLSKIDLVSQAEREIISAMIADLPDLNPTARIFPIDGLCGYGVELLAREILITPKVESFEGDLLRYSMPAGVCSYCIGEQRIGKEFQQGVVRKINFEGGA